MDITSIVRNSGIYRRLAPYTRPFRNVLYSMATLYQYGQTDMFTTVSIETISVCNRSCWYCPVSIPEYRNQRPAKRMDTNLYTHIIDELASIGYKGKIAFQHYGEPLLDKQLEKRIAEARRVLPDSYLIFASNGDYLTPDRLQSLVKVGIDRIIVTNHNTDGVLSPSLAETLQFVRDNPKYSSYVGFRQGVEKPKNRGGLLPMSDDERRRLTKCVEESYTFNIDVDGNVLICADDYLGAVRFGNVRKEHIMRIWNKPDWRQVREDKKKGIFTLDICKKCV